MLFPRLPFKKVIPWGLGALGLTGLVGVLLCCLADFDPANLESTGNLVFQDRKGELLRYVPDPESERSSWIPLSRIPQPLQDAFIVAEDERFYLHPGFDPLAILRAAAGNLREGRITSGASTITQQLVRQIYPRPRSWYGKAAEIVRAAKAEWVLSKEQIIEEYLNRVPMGNNLVGVGIAAQAYFSKDLNALSASECAVLAALPKSPGRLNPLHKDLSRLRARRNWVLGRLYQAGLISEEAFQQALRSPIRIIHRPFPSEAPHFVEALLAREPTSPTDGSFEGRGPRLIRTTLDLDLQHHVEKTLQSHKTRLADLGATQAAVLVVQNQDCSVLALAGSVGYGPIDQGYNNGTLAQRSPGSALKPFLYGLALESGYTAASLLEDTERRYHAKGGEYFPRNYDRRDYGPATVRTALGNSLNLSAVSLIGHLGVPKFHQTLSNLGLVNDSSRSPESYGLGLAIGNPEVTLEQLTAAYAMLANGGIYRPLRYRLSESVPSGKKVFTPQTAFILTDILSDPTARALTFGFSSELDFPYRVAWKTGTSTRYRDGWVVGFTPRYTVGVWTGNFDGSPMKKGGGATGAGPIFSEILHDLYRNSSPQPFVPPSGLIQSEICSHSGMLPGPNCPARMNEWFLADAPPKQTCTFHKEGGLHHQLDSPYAGWVFDRHQQSTSTPYTLGGRDAGEFSNPWEPLSPGDGAPCVTVMGTPREASVPAPARPSVLEPGMRVSIGSSRKDHWPLDPEASDRMAIIYPLDGDRILFPENGDPGPLMFQARLDGPASQMAWYVDGVEYARTGPPYRTSWRLSRGGHRITVVGEDGLGDEITIQVE